MAGLIAQLRAALPHDGGVLTDPDVLRSYEHDEADLVPYGTPAVVVRPRTTGQVSAVLRAAGRHRVPVIPQGARSGLAGGANAIDGAIVLSLVGMNEIIDIDTENRIAVVQPGVVNAQLRRAVAEVGLYYPPDPGSWEQSTIGGNVSTDAGGMCCVKYGVTSDHVLGLEVVLASGEVLACGRRTAKGVAGYDLTSLFVGAEGTLGVITEITVRLRPAPEPSLTLVAVFDTFAAAGAAVSAVVGSGLQPSMLEVIDRVAMGAIEAYRPMDLPTAAAALLIASVDSGSRAPDDLAAIAAMCRSAQASDVFVAADEAEADALLAARRLAHVSLEALAARLFPGGGGIMVDDVAVPRTRLVELIEGIERISAEHGVVVATVGHAGDGNLHPVIVIDRSDPVSIAQGQRVFDAIMALGLALGGTSTGEHGVGLLKRDWLAREIGPTGLKAHRSIKAALDPDNILNPGKIF
ncbi:FAD-binding oxidoreductase [Dactylosporangium matsuzakiense]|uniref:FAD-linked oxidase n=1 Tax=Dactylosporangium matsuzakiense TaxID=53360 RepID=A0A9W6KVM2_9ACTN|nr:FAD-linked oxidase C-terminal domain-containing protein [Dactylosporangium matsuzakiense]UWZ49290.1 FAD-binding protein [Dactylosporangium matsuzakiense]GLL08133.1 FAD-linked oxidase [Dactylosporangium matsuzakiense]